MARPAFAGRRARSRTGQLGAFGAVVAVVTAALAILAGAMGPVLDAGSIRLVRQSGPEASAVRVDARLTGDASAQDAGMRDTIAEALRGIDTSVSRSVRAVAEATIAEDPVTVLLLSDEDASTAADLVAGAWPEGPGEAAPSERAAELLGLAPGDELVLGDARLLVSGVWTPRDPADARWFGDPAVGSGRDGDAVGPLLVDESMLAALSADARVRWTVIPGDDALTVAALPGTADALARLDTAVRRLGGEAAASLQGTLPETLARATRVTAVASGMLGLPFALVGVAGALVLGLVARAISVGRAGEFLLLRARGASMRGLTAPAAGEAAVVASLAAALGAAAATAVLGSVLPVLGVRSEPVPLVAVLVASATVVVAAGIVAAATVAELRAPTRGRTDTGAGSPVLALTPFALALLAAGVALGQFLSLGAPVVVRSDGVVRTDPLAVAAPVLVLLAGVLAVPVIAGPVVGIVERVARGARGILPVLPLRQLARSARTVAAATLVVALAAGAVVLGVLFQTGATVARIQAERDATGADLRVVLPGRTTVELGSEPASSAMLDGVDGVDDAFAVLAATAGVGEDAFPLVAGDAARLAALPGASGLTAVAEALPATPPGAELPAGATDIAVRMLLTPSQGVPAGLGFGLEAAVWLADRDGVAFRVPLGTVPIQSGAVETTATLPAAARLLAIELQPPTLPAASVVDVALDEVAVTGDRRIAFPAGMATTLTSRHPQRLPAGAVDGSFDGAADAPMPVAVSQALAARLGAVPGTEFTMRVGAMSEPVPVRVVAIPPRLPGSGTGPAVLADLAALQSRAVLGGGSVPAANQLWVSTDRPDAVATALRGVLAERAVLVIPDTRSPAPLLDPLAALLIGGVAVTVLLAAAGFVAVSATDGPRRRAELAPLRSLGLTAARVRSARAIELVAALVIAVVLGAAAGLLTAVLVVPGLTGVLV